MVLISPVKIKGNWSIGYALDLHTVSSTLIGHDDLGRAQFDTQRSEVGQLVYDIKYSGKLEAATEIIDTAYDFIIKTYVTPSTLSFDRVVPVPPSTYRIHQPVFIIADGLARKLDIIYNPCIHCKSTSQVKNIHDQDERNKELLDKYSITAGALKGMSVLLIDDLYRSGSTLNTVANLVRQTGQAIRVDVLAITKTRANR